MGSQEGENNQQRRVYGEKSRNIISRTSMIKLCILAMQTSRNIVCSKGDDGINKGATMQKYS